MKKNGVETTLVRRQLKKPSCSNTALKRCTTTEIR